MKSIMSEIGDLRIEDINLMYDNCYITNIVWDKSDKKLPRQEFLFLNKRLVSLSDREILKDAIKDYLENKYKKQIKYLKYKVIYE